MTSLPSKSHHQIINFASYAVTLESVHTAVLLLKSTEPNILCQTLRALTIFSAQDMKNRQVLFDLDGIHYILPHVEHPELNVRRFALKALAQLCQLPQGPMKVLADPQTLKKIAFMLVKVEDVFVLEFASLVLSELTKVPLGCEQLVAANILSTLCSRMKQSLDPDVQKNCLQTLSNLLNSVWASQVTMNKEFSLSSVISLMHSQYLGIQNAALKTLGQLATRYDDEVVQTHFRSPPGVTELCEILETYAFADVHAMVLEVLCNYVATEENVDYLYKSGCVLRLQAYLEMALPLMKPHCLAVLTKISFTYSGRHALFETGADLVFCHHILGMSVELHADAAMGVANMTKLLPSAVRMSDTNIIPALCAILGDDTAAWYYVRINSLRALSELCRKIPKAAVSLVEPETFAALRNINKKFKDTPIEAQRLAVQCYINIQTYYVSEKAMLNMDFVQEMLMVLQQIDISLKKMACVVLTGLMNQEITKDLFTRCKGEEVVSVNLHIKHNGLLTALCTLISASVTNEGAEEYLRLGTIHYMVENREARYTVRAWEPALEAIFRHHSSAKLAYTGRLDINDYTQEGFYVQKRLSSPFPTLEELLSRGPSKDPVYICQFQPPQSESGYDIGNPDRKLSSSLSRSSFGLGLTMLNDVNLRSYLFKQRMWFGDPAQSLHYVEIEGAHYEVKYRDKYHEVETSLKERAQMLAEFVAEQMGGTDQERDCSMPTVSLHLSDLMNELDSCVIGLGWIRYGGALERALLYKVLADRIGLPCALHRRSGAHAWCEVAVPEPDPQDQSAVKPTTYPAGLLRANYVVDLTVRPGRLLPRGGYEARLVCGPECAPYTARTQPYINKMS